MSIGTVSMILAALIIPSSAFAGQTPSSAVQVPSERFYDPARGMSLEDAIDMALRQEPTLRASKAAVEIARGARTQAALRPNPSASFEWRDEPSGTDNQTMVSVQWPLDLFRRSGRVNVADREVVAAELAALDHERTIRADVRSRYGDVLDAIRRLMLADELLAVSQRQHELLRARVQAGASPPLERDLLQVEVKRLESERVLHLGRIESAVFALKRSVGLDATAPLTIRDTLEDIVQREGSSTSPVPDAPTAETDRPDVREAAARIATAAAKVDRAEREGRIDLALFGGYQRMDAGFPQSGISPAGGLERVHAIFHYVSAGAMVTIPLFNRNQGEVAAARAEQTSARASHEALRLAAQSEIASARSLDQRTHEALNVFTGDARALARRNLDVVSESYSLGRMTVFDVVAEQRRFLELELAYSEALRAAFDARTALLLAVGGAR